MNIYIVAGETSGDAHAALMLEELKQIIPDLSVKGLGGERIHALYPDVTNWTDEAAVMGFVEVIKKISYFRRRFKELLAAIRRDRPDIVILVDYAGFNVRMAEAIKKEMPEIKTVCMIAPQVWAWNKGRIPKIARVFDLMLCIFPFEKPLFEGAGLRTEFIGHPLAREIAATRKDNLREEHLIGLFPGSREGEIRRHFPVMMQFATLFREHHPDYTFETAASSPKIERILHELVHTSDVDPSLVNIRLGNYHELMDRATAGVVASGTATMEATLHKLPYVLVYRTAPWTYWLAKRLVKIPHIGIVNVLARRLVVTELIQDDFTPERVFNEVELMLKSEHRDKLLNDFAEVEAMLEQGDASRNAAEAIASLK